MKKAITYVRRSTDMQEASLNDQRQTIQTYAQEHDLTITKEFCDDAISGKTVKARPAFQEMIEFARNNQEEHTLLVYDVSRFGRFENPKEATYWEVELERNNIQVHYITEGFSNDGSLGSYITKVVKDAEASEYVKKLAKLTKRGIESCAQRGFWMGSRAPYGYTRAVVEPSTGEIESLLKPGERNPIKGKRIKLVPDDPERIKVVRKIFDLYANQEQGLTSIIKYLHKKGVANPSGKEFWHKTTLRNMLKNQTYLGVIVLHKATQEEIYVEDAHEAIIDRDIFQRVQQRLQKVKFAQGGGHTTPYLLTRLLICGGCKNNFHGNTNRDRRGYRCSSNSNIGNVACKARYYSAKSLEDPVLNHIETQMEADTWPDQVRKAMDHALGEDSRNLNNRLEEAQTEYLQNEKRTKNLLEAIADGLQRQTAIQAITKIEARQEDLEQIINKVEAKQQVGQKYERTAVFLKELPKKWQTEWSRSTPQEKKRLVRMFLAKAVVYDKKREATYHFYEFPNITDEGHNPPPTVIIQEKINS